MDNILSELSNTMRDAVGNAKVIFESIYKPSNIIDILFVAFLIYQGIKLIRRSNLKNLTRGLMILMIVYALSEILDMKMIKILIQKTVELSATASAARRTITARRSSRRSRRSFWPPGRCPPARPAR